MLIKYPKNIFFIFFLINITPPCVTAAHIPEPEHDPMLPIEQEEGEIAQFAYYRQNIHRDSDDELNSSVTKILSSPELLFSFLPRNTEAVTLWHLQQDTAKENAESLPAPEILPAPSSAGITLPSPLRRFSKRKSEPFLEADEERESKSLKLFPYEALASNKPLVVKDTASSTQQNDAKTYVCTLCKKQFWQKSDLTRHMLTHTGERPFACTECDKKFAEKSKLTRHMLTHTREKPFPCTECEKKFTQNSDLKRHMLTHTGEQPFTCIQCDKKFARNSDLTAHMRTHTGERPFECTKCGNRFAHKSTLTIHKRTHTGEKPFACTECAQKFAQKSNLTTHMRTHE